MSYLEQLNIIHYNSGLSLYSRSVERLKHNPQLLTGMFTALFSFFQEEIGSDIRSIDLNNSKLILATYNDLRIVIKVKHFTHPKIGEVFIKEIIRLLQTHINFTSKNPNDYLEVLSEGILDDLFYMETQEELLQSNKMVNYLEESVILIEKERQLIGYHVGDNFKEDATKVLNSTRNVFTEMEFRVDPKYHNNYQIKTRLDSLPSISCLSISLSQGVISEAIIIHVLTPAVHGKALQNFASFFIDYFSIADPMSNQHRLYFPHSEETHKHDERTHRQSLAFNLLRPVLNEVLESLFRRNKVYIFGDEHTLEITQEFLKRMLPTRLFDKKLSVVNDPAEITEDCLLIFLPRKLMRNMDLKRLNYVEIGNYTNARLHRSHYFSSLIQGDGLDLMELIGLYNSIVTELVRAIDELIYYCINFNQLHGGISEFHDFFTNLSKDGTFQFVEEAFLSHFPQMDDSYKRLQNMRESIMEHSSFKSLLIVFSVPVILVLLIILVS